MVADPLACYGSGLNELANTVKEPIDVASDDVLTAWKVARWRATADAFGFREEVEPGLQAALKSKGQLGSVDQVGANTWILASSKREYPYPDAYPRNAIDKARHAVLEQLRESPGSLWRVSRDAVELPGRACVNEYRVFPSSNAPNYFDSGTSEKPTPRTCVWTSPVVIYLGTWPWFHGSSLVRDAPGLRWKDSGPTQPARQAIRVYSSVWSLEGNAAVDARDVYSQYDYFRRQTDPLVANLGTSPKSPGSLYRAEGGFIEAYLTDPDKAYLNGPLGPVAVTAYNHVLRCVAAFFALRRAMMGQASRLPIKAKNMLKGNPDPCVNKLADEKPKNPGVIKG